MLFALIASIPTSTEAQVRGDRTADIDVRCVSGCSGGTTDTDDGSVAGAQSTGLQIALAYLWNGSTWERATPVTDPCDGAAKTVYVVDISASGTVEIANPAGADTFYYVCSVNLVTLAANNVAIASDDSDNCGSITAGMNGGVTAGEGWNFGANGGIALGNGSGTVMKTATANHALCILTSAATQLSGSITYVSGD